MRTLNLVLFISVSLQIGILIKYIRWCCLCITLLLFGNHNFFRSVMSSANIIIYYERKRIQSSEQLGMNRYRHHYEIGSRKQAIVVSASVKRSAYSGGA